RGGRDHDDLRPRARDVRERRRAVRRTVVGAAIVAALALPIAAGAQPTPATKPGPAATPRKDKDDRSQPVTVDADKMERFGKEGLVVFTGNVVARQNNSVQYADRMEVYLDESGDRIVRTVSTGAVRIITRDCRTAIARHHTYYEPAQRVVPPRTGPVRSSACSGQTAPARRRPST